MAVEIGIGADVAPFRREIDTLSDAARSEAREIARALDRGIDDAAGDISRSLGGIGDHFGELGDVAEKALKKMGAAGGEVADVLFDFAGPLASVAGGFGSVGVAAATAGGALTAFGLVAAGTVYGMVSIAGAALDARDRLVEAGLAAEIPESAQASLARYEDAQGDLQIAADRLIVKLADKGGVIDAVVGLTNATTGLVTVLDNSVGSVIRLAAAAVDFGGALAPLVSVFNPVAGAALEAASSVDDLYTSLQLIGQTPGTSLASVLDPEQFRITAEQVAAVTESLEGGADRGLAGAATAANEELVDTSKLLDAIAKATPKSIAGFQGLTASQEDIGLALDANAKKFRLNQEGWQALGNAAAEVTANTLAGIEQITANIIDSYEARVAAGEELSEQEKAAARRALIANKAAAISQIIISAAQSYAGFVAAFAPLGPGAPIAAAALVASGLIAPVAAILGEPIPVSFASSQQAGGGEPGVAPTSVGAAPDQNSNYKDEDNPDSKAPGFVGSGKNSRSSNSSGEVAVTVVFPSGRVGKRRIY